jgi:putative hemolysin
LIIGELVPKQIALRDPERVAARVAPAMVWISRLAAPLVSLLDLSGRAVLFVLGHKHDANETVSDEEVRTVIAEAASAGVLAPEEREMISGVMRLADRSVRGLMTPRRDAEIIDLADDPVKLRQKIRAAHRSKLLVQDGDADSIVGVVMVKDLVDVFADGVELDLGAFVQQVPIVMDTVSALHALRLIRASRVQMVLVFDEYGHFEGLITPADVLESITGAFHDDTGEEPAVVIRDDGSFLVSGWMPVDEFSDQFRVPVARGGYETVAGFMLAEFNRLPEVGEAFEKDNWRFEVVDRDGLRIDKILVAPTGEQADAA